MFSAYQKRYASLKLHCQKANQQVHDSTSTHLFTYINITVQKGYRKQIEMKNLLLSGEKPDDHIRRRSNESHDYEIEKVRYKRVGWRGVIKRTRKSSD
jgi:hypothetical protein